MGLDRLLLRRRAPRVEDEVASAQPTEEARSPSDRRSSASPRGTPRRNERGGSGPAQPGVEPRARALARDDAEDVIPAAEGPSPDLPDSVGQPRRATTKVIPTGARARLRGEVADAAATVERALAELGAPAHVVAATVGPTITRLGLAPAVVEHYAPDGTLRKRERIRVAKILSRANDLALALGARSLRLEAPVPGQPYIGLEVPNREAVSVSLTAMVADKAFKAFEEKAALPVALGRDVAGRPVLADVARLPHLLVAGSTGSGKSVALNSLLAALLSRRTPEQLRLLVLDPKRVEFAWLEKVAHLLAPVVVDPEAAVEVLGKLETEMGRRYDLLAQAGVRDLASYNARVVPPVPRLLLVVDELADLMMLAPDDVERSICRLAQLGRAAGIHMVVATQRPSVNVITGLIKANLPARLAFAVASQVDSRTILDGGGAELLLGRGDFLYQPADAPKPIRGQGSVVDEADVQRIARRNRRKRGERDDYAALFDSLQTAATQAAQELYRRAVELAESSDRVSASFLQRKLRIGYARAKELLELLREEGVVDDEE